MIDIQRWLLIAGLAITSYMLVLAWNEDYNKPMNTTGTNALETVPDQLQGGETAGVPGTDNLLGIPSVQVPETVPTAVINDEIPQAAVSEAQQPVTASRKVVHIETDVLRLLIDPLGGDIIKVELLDYPVSLSTRDIPYVLVNPSNNYVTQTGLIGPDGTDSNLGRPEFHTASLNYQLEPGMDRLQVDLHLEQPSGVRLIKRFTFRPGDYLINIDYIIENTKTEPWRGRLFSQIKRNGQLPTRDESGMGMQPYVGGATFTADEPYRKLEFEDLEEQSYRYETNGGYMAMVQKYFVTALVPQNPEGTHIYQARKLSGRDLYLFGMMTSDWQIPPGMTDSRGVNFYAGPKDQYRLRDIAKGLDLTIDYGFLWWLAQPLFWLLMVIHELVNNWGYAIIGLTLIVKIMLYPLSAASFRSMAKMRKLQPEMVRLKERFGDDRQKFSVAMMDLYKKEGANPLGGCLPILLQMPVFLSLYWVIMESVEIRQAPFALWIHDLSAMDPYFVLPILMGGSMWLTQSLQPEPPDPVQAKVFKMMPIMFTFFFLWFPSGLVLYWLVNNVLSILQQWYVNRQISKAS
ncbi:MAG: membrane protein insertase YidC [Gammaproteobacteria bacterium]|nr:membrane protein insertase YidC [Gammaproteobacteria bacterium]